MAERRYNKPWSVKNRPWLLKWRPPESHERDLRVIDGQHHVWNPKRRGWEKTRTHVNVNVNANNNNNNNNANATSQYNLRIPRGHLQSNHSGDRGGRVRTSPDRTKNRHREPSERYAPPEQGAFGDKSMRRDGGTQDSPIVVEGASDLDHDHDHQQHKQQQHKQQQRDDGSPRLRKRKRVSLCVDDESESMVVAEKESQAPAEHASTSTRTTTTNNNNATTNSPPLGDTDPGEWRLHLQRSLDENNMLSEKFRELREKYENKSRVFEELQVKHSELSKVLDTVHQSKSLMLRSNEKKEAALNARIQALEEKLNKRGPQGSTDEVAGHGEESNTATSDQPKAKCDSDERAQAQTETEPSENQKLLAQLETTRRELAAANHKVASTAGRLDQLQGHNTELLNELASHRTTLEAVRAEKEEAEANLEDLQYDNDVYSQRLKEVMLRVGKLEARDRTRKASLEKCQKELEQAREKEAATTVKEPPKEEHKPNKEVDHSRIELEKNYANLQNDFNTLAMQVARQSRTIEEQHQELRRWNERVGPHGIGGSNPGMPLKIED